MFKILWRVFPFLLVLIIALLFWKLFNIFSDLFSKQEKVVINHTTILREIESMGKLELVKYHFKDVVEFEKEDYSWLPSSKVVLIAGGEAVGCIDLRKIKDQDIYVKGDTAFISLPEPELCYFKIDHEKSKVYNLQYTYFQDKNLIDEAYKVAEKQLKKSALEMNILGKTRENAELILRPILEKLSGKHVIISYSNVDLPQQIQKE